MRCEAIRGLEKTFCSDNLGKWFLLTTKAQEEDVKKFVDKEFPKIFKCFEKKTREANKIYPLITGPRCGTNDKKEDAVDFLAQSIQAEVKSNRQSKDEDTSRPPQDD